jgi:hypothetical protein
MANQTVVTKRKVQVEPRTLTICTAFPGCGCNRDRPMCTSTDDDDDGDDTK